jgi:hypothetical protein
MYILRYPQDRHIICIMKEKRSSSQKLTNASNILPTLGGGGGNDYLSGTPQPVFRFGNRQWRRHATFHSIFYLLLARTLKHLKWQLSLNSEYNRAWLGNRFCVLLAKTVLCKHLRKIKSDQMMLHSILHWKYPLSLHSHFQPRWHFKVFKNSG